MKKKNIIKKLMSVILSAATVFSLLTLPAQAIIPGEDAYAGPQEDGYIRVNLENQTTEFIPESDIPQFEGDCTYDALNPADRARLDAINEEISNEILQGVSGGVIAPAAVEDGEYYYVSPTYNRYSGVVLITTWKNNVYIGHGTGFLLDDSTVMTALHVLYDYVDPDSMEEFDLSGDIPDEIRVYYDVSIDLMKSTELATNIAVLEYLESSDAHFVTMRNPIYSSAVNPSNNGDDYNYDWMLGKLSTPLTGRYYWNCAVPTGNLAGKTSFVVGYPEGHLFRMTETSGTISHVVTDSNATVRNLITYTNSNAGGMSGAPLYSEWGGVRCYGVHIGRLPTLNSSIAVQIYEDLFNVIVDYMG